MSYTSGKSTRRLMRFSADRWTRASYVAMNNTLARPLVDEGYLEQRVADMGANHQGKRPMEYRLTPAGKALIEREGKA